MAKAKTKSKSTKSNAATNKSSKAAAKSKPKAKPAPKVAAKPAAKSATKAAPTKAAAKAAPAKPAPAKPAPAKSTSAKSSLPTGGGEADKLWQQYCEKPDRELLRVYADALANEGHPRGAFINLCLLDDPSDEQKAAKETMLAKQKKLLAGPGGEFLREFDFGPDGLVARARTEAANVIAGLDAIKALNPRLVLTITSIKTQKDAEAFGKLDLGDIWFVDFGWITGTHGGMKLNDKQLAAVAPALVNVRNLQLSLRGNPAQCASPAGVRAFCEQMKRLRFLALDIYQPEMPPAAEYARAIAEAPALRQTLRGVDLEGVTASDFPGMSIVVNTGLLDGGCPTSESRDAMEQGREFADQLDAALG